MSREEPERYLIERIRDALAHDARVMELGVKVNIAGGKVFVTGPVSTEERRRAVADVVHEVAPEYEVHNETTVGPFPEVEEAEELS